MQVVRDTYKVDASIKIMFFEYDDDPLAYTIGQAGRIPLSSIKARVDLSRASYDAAAGVLQLSDDYYGELTRLVAGCEVEPTSDMVLGADAQGDAAFSICPACHVSDSNDQFLLCDQEGCHAEVHIACMDPPLPANFSERDPFYCDADSRWTCCKRAWKRRRRRRNSRYRDSDSDVDGE